MVPAMTMRLFVAEARRRLGTPAIFCARTTRWATGGRVHDSTVPAVFDAHPRTMLPSMGADAPPCFSMGNDREGNAPAAIGQCQPAR
jgi:hypothetical protein